MLVRIGSRGSKLALTQAEQAAARLRRRGVEVAFVPITTRMLNKLLHLPTVRMKEAAVTAEGVAYAEAVRHLFGLEEEL